MDVLIRKRMKRGALFIILMTFVIVSSALAAEKRPLTEGERLYRSKCASCHRLLPPKKYSDEKWEEYVIKYGKKIKEEERQKILEYLKGSNDEEKFDIPTFKPK